MAAFRPRSKSVANEQQADEAKCFEPPQATTIDTRAASYVRDKLVDSPNTIGQGSNARAVFPLGRNSGRFPAFGQRQKVAWSSKHSMKYANRSHVELMTHTAGASFDIHRPLNNSHFGDIRPPAKFVDRWNRPDWKINNFDQHLGYRNVF